jgi:hypothetical protein
LNETDYLNSTQPTGLNETDYLNSTQSIGLNETDYLNSTQPTGLNETDYLNSTQLTGLNQTNLTTQSPQIDKNLPNLLFNGNHQPRNDLGINVGSINHFMLQWVFVNKFKHAREWQTVASRSNWFNYSMAGAIPNTVFSSDGYLLNFSKSSYSTQYIKLLFFLF